MLLNKPFIIVFVALLGLTSSLYGQLDRNNYGALLEIDDVVLHGAGQSPDAFESYFDLMPEDNKPQIYMYYISLNALNEAFWVDYLKEELEKYSNHYIIPQIGLSMTGTGDPNDNYEDDVAAGLYDDQILNLVEGLKKLGRPAYIRIGYEFNGIAWNGYDPGPYVEAYQRITTAISNNDLEVATVWCAAVGGGTDENYLDYYPGDDYVDWWGIDLFSDSHFTEQLTIDFMADAEVYGKPVMIGETTPRYIGADDATDWEDWFVLFFDFIENYPGVKAFCYINWDWAEFPQWSDWGNAQLSENDFVRVNYAHRIRGELYRHATTQSDFRSLLNFNDNTAPNAVTISGSAQDVLPIQLNWNPVSDPNNVLYAIYKNDNYYSAVYGTEFVDENYAAGQTISYKVKAMDWAGNESDFSNSLEYQLGDTIVKTLNSSFEETIWPWRLDTYEGGQASQQVIDDELIVNIDNSTTTNWHVQVIQRIDLLEENQYFIETTARASESGPAGVIIQRSRPPFDIPVYQGVNLQTNNTDFSTMNYTATEDDRMNVGFYLGELNTGNQVVIDEITLFEINGRDDFVENEAPVSVAGDDFVFSDPFVVLDLDGSGSFDSDGSIVSYQWEQLSGLEVLTIDNPNSAITKLSDVAIGDYVFRLTVTDIEGKIASDDIWVTIEALPLVNTKEYFSNATLKLSPNPTSDELLIALEGKAGHPFVSFRIVDFQGRVVMQNDQQLLTVDGTGEGFALDVSDLSSGIFVIYLATNERSYVEKFVVDKR